MIAGKANSFLTENQADMDDKIKVVDFKKADEFAAMLEANNRYLATFPPLMEQIARQRKISYDAHLAAGFSNAQALSLCVVF